MMVEPEAGTEVFAMDIRTSSEGEGKYTSGFPVDMSIANNYDSVGNSFLGTRLTNSHLQTNTTVAESSSSGDYNWNYNDGLGIGEGGAFFGASRNNINWMFKRAKGFFDVVAYTGNYTNGRNINHSLGVAPEMMIVKNRGAGGAFWAVYHDGNTASPETDYLQLDSDAATIDNIDLWYDTPPGVEVFTVGTSTMTNSNSSHTYIAYLFASLAGVSKVGSYTGNGSSQTIDCGFSGGARFILIKRTDAAGGWWFWDTERGIVTGNDPHLRLDSSGAEVTTDDSIDPESSGFTINQVSSWTNINVTGSTYIFLAIA
jgi:hypothetical protein